MAKFYGAVGYAEENVEDPPDSGIWKEHMVAHFYYGDVVRNTRVLHTGDKINDDISTTNSISVVADAYALEHFFAIRYVEWAGAKWTVSEVEVQSPRLLMHLGGVYNGPTA